MQTSASIWTTTTRDGKDHTVAYPGTITVAGSTFDVFLNLDDGRPSRITPDTWASITGPEGNALMAKVTTKVTNPGAYLLSALADLTQHRPDQDDPIDWQPLTLPSGRAVRQMEAATVEFLDERIPVFARFDEDMSAAYGDGFPGVVATGQNQGGRELTVYVPSKDTTRGEVFRILAELGRID
ncbi:hypothetical protein [Nocardiopsis sp. TNDT3]|uniref:hypothetical protein n=1 Tax=Nocardiopsis sp. TNDT3 TaxID=2249354 RepID=UPI000E3BCF12|nr:hypothetical protein [Nocardiopsis sp. TNDT3]